MLYLTIKYNGHTVGFLLFGRRSGQFIFLKIMVIRRYSNKQTTHNLQYNYLRKFYYNFTKSTEINLIMLRQIMADL